MQHYFNFVSIFDPEKNDIVTTGSAALCGSRPFGRSGNSMSGRYLNHIIIQDALTNSISSPAAERIYAPLVTWKK